MLCYNCGKEIPDNIKFCPFCGGKIEFATTDVASDPTPGITKEEVTAKIIGEMITQGQQAVYANMEHQPQKESDSQFGLVPEKPIYTAGIDEQEEYLKSLRTENGEPIKWSRRGSMSVNGVHGMIDIYDIYLISGAEYKTIYINMYGAENSTTAPRGFVLMAKAPQAKAVNRPMPKVQKPKKPVNKKLVVCLTVIPTLILLVTLLVVFLLIPGLKYNHAKKLLENGKYELAYSEFLALGDFSNSKEMLLECRYAQAVKYRDAGDYELANKIFESLGNYRDSKILIHKHDYRVISRTEATCTDDGNEVFECSGCKDSYTNYLEASHKYVVTKTIDSTCTATGNKELTCSVCQHSYSELIAKKSHSYSNATCTSPKTCSICKTTTGTALGHTKDLICTRCGKSTFKKLTYSGNGPSSITGITLPAGKYNFKFTHSGSSNFVVYFSRGGSSQNLIVNEVGNVSYVYQVTAYSDFGEIENGYINITRANGNWTLTIEAVSN